MSSQSPSPDPRPVPQPGGMPRVPGNRTPRRVQWASAIDEDMITVPGRTRENALETHELDEAGLDVRATDDSSNTLLLTRILVHTASCVPNACPRS